ncbi:hypothetical protein [Xylella phage Xfas53]|nr:hypothetical protein [Xylella phage Xfas53]
MKSIKTPRHSSYPMNVRVFANTCPLSKPWSLIWSLKKRKKKDAEAEKLKEGTHREAALGELQERTTGGHGDERC